jgi:hypothetical protein
VRLPSRIVAVHEALATADLPHAFGGALALAWCTERARGTIDIDVNVFVAVEHTETVLAALPAGVVATAEQRAQLSTDGQTRLWWDQTPLDVFLDTTDFHRGVADRIRWEQFGDVIVPFLSCRDLAVFKAFFDRTKDWADLEEMQAAGTLDVAWVAGVLVTYLGGADHRIERLRQLSGEV